MATLAITAIGCDSSFDASESSSDSSNDKGAHPDEADAGPPREASVDRGTGSSAAPTLLFTDIAAGPRSGNTDTSKGQTSGLDGAIVTVWGLNLGGSQGASTMTIGAVPIRTFYYWGNAVRPWSPANLYNGYHKLGCVIFQVPSETPMGLVKIVATVAGRTSSPLPFSVQGGRIYFASTAGDDAVSANPALVSSAGVFELHVAPNSPAIGAGVNLGFGSLDFDGFLRPRTAWNIGAY
jgi:hypothetical protein